MPSQDRVCVSLTKPIELSGDILIKVYERQSDSRGTICRAQVNTSTIHGDRLTLRKPELDVAITGNPHTVSTITICTNLGDKTLNLYFFDHSLRISLRESPELGLLIGLISGFV